MTLPPVTEPRVKSLDLQTVLSLGINQRLYAVLPDFQPLHVAMQAMAEAIAALQRQAKGRCLGCLYKKQLLKEYAKPYTLFVDIYLGLWRERRAALAPLLDLLQADRVDLLSSGGQKFSVERPKAI